MPGPLRRTALALASAIRENLRYEYMRRGTAGEEMFWGGAIAFGEDRKRRLLTPTANRRTAGLRKLVGTAPRPGTNTVLVTHKPNILDAFGKDWFDVREGEASLFRPSGFGKLVPVARVQAADWVKAAGD